MSHGLSQAMRMKMQMRFASSIATTASAHKILTEAAEEEEEEEEESCNNFKTLNDLSISSTRASSEHPSVFALDFNMEMNKLSFGSSRAPSEPPSLCSLDFRELNELSKTSSRGCDQWVPSLSSLDFTEHNSLSKGSSSQAPPERPSLSSLEFAEGLHDHSLPEEAAAKGMQASLLGATVLAYPPKRFIKCIGTVTSVRDRCLLIEFDDKKFGEITLPEGQSVEVRRKLTEEELALYCQKQDAEPVPASSIIVEPPAEPAEEETTAQTTLQRCRRGGDGRHALANTITMAKFFALCQDHGTLGHSD